GALALALVAIGLYGTLASAVDRRRRELGIRMSLGAARGDILRMILRESMIMAASGVALGIPLSIAAARGLSGLLFGVGAADPVTFAPAIALVFGVALAAAYVPARRAAHVDPLVALRTE